MKWDDHVAVITSKAAKRFWFLKKLKRAGVVREDLVYLYQAVVRPIWEYACPAWHTSLTKEQTKSLEDIQRRAHCSPGHHRQHPIIMKKHVVS